jgi:phenylpropionate dioxygenase-like ring-hydroxylating dioxygenase large terminal subunit/AcrR family transcriptional regulator
MGTSAGIGEVWCLIWMDGMSETTRDRKDERRQQLIEATIRAISRHGYSRTTLADVSRESGLSRGIVGFYFDSKEALFLETLRYLADEYAGVWQTNLSAAGNEPRDRIMALLDADLDPRVWSLDRIAAWVAFLAESKGRQTYRELYGAMEDRFHDELKRQIGAIISTAGYVGLDAERITRTLGAMQQGFWYDLLFYGESYSREDVHRSLMDVLAAFFPAEFGAYTYETIAQIAPARAASETGKSTKAPAGATKTLPAWAYKNDEFFDLEMEHVVDTSWQVVGHLSDLANPGDYVTLDYANRRVFVIRDKQGDVKAFHNVCRHRAARLCLGKEGNHRFNIVCPYHGWSYAFDGGLKAMPAKETFPDLDTSKFGLKPVELDVWNGFVFVRLRDDGGPRVGELMAAYEAELAPYRLAEMTPIGEVWDSEPVDVDWKNMMDNYLEGYHINVGHPGLYRMFGANYWVEADERATGRALSTLVDEPSEVWSEGHYMRLLPRFDHLPEDRQRAWAYYSLFPNQAIDIYPDQISIFHVVPIGAGKCFIRGRNYALADDRREVEACRWLNVRINNLVQREDDVLVARVQDGLGSGAYTTGYFSEKEACLAAFHNNVRARLPLARLDEAPAAGTLADVNDRLARGFQEAAE